MNLAPWFSVPEVAPAFLISGFGSSTDFVTVFSIGDFDENVGDATLGSELLWPSSLAVSSASGVSFIMLVFTAEDVEEFALVSILFLLIFSGGGCDSRILGNDGGLSCTLCGL